MSARVRLLATSLGGVDSISNCRARVETMPRTPNGLSPLVDPFEHRDTPVADPTESLS